MFQSRDDKTAIELFLAGIRGWGTYGSFSPENPMAVDQDDHFDHTTATECDTERVAPQLRLGRYSLSLCRAYAEAIESGVRHRGIKPTPTRHV